MCVVLSSQLSIKFKIIMTYGSFYLKHPQRFQCFEDGSHEQRKFFVLLSTRTYTTNMSWTRNVRGCTDAPCTITPRYNNTHLPNLLVF